jgi:hypothetical protein
MRKSLKIFTGFERRQEKLAPWSVFIWRLVRFFCFGLVMIGVALFIGVAGYHWVAGFDWINSLLEASMILGGMGPVNGDHLGTHASKVFASGYALFSGLIFIAAMSIILSPIMHRFLHTFHLDRDPTKGSKKS